MKIIVRLVKSFGVDLAILAVCVAIFLSLAARIKPVRVGDGSEYYALYLAWDTTHRPYLTEKSWSAYQELVATDQVASMMKLDALKNTSIPLGSTADLPHFWFYSFCAAVIAGLVSVLSVQVQAQTAFLMLHGFLLVLLLIVAWRSYRWYGLAAATALTFLSPMVWYLDKVHTEFFTFCMTTSAVILFLKKQYFFAALFIALAATQNISFAAISLVVMAIGAWDKGLKLSLLDGGLILLSAAIIGLQPVYYYHRFHQFLPQFIQGTAKIGEYLRYSYAWFFDPDIGLLPNWLLGILLLALGVYAAFRKGLKRTTFLIWLVFCATYVGVSLLAQSSTTNLNSGGTPGVARYALWYIALFFPVALLAIEQSFHLKWAVIIPAGLCVLGFMFNLKYYNPALSENSYIKPSMVSYWVQTRIPGLYNPPPEIFEERYGGIGEMIEFTNAFAVLGPDCHKVLVVRAVSQSNGIVYGANCGLDPTILSQTIQRNLELGTWRAQPEPAYYSLSDKEINPQ